MKTTEERRVKYSRAIFLILIILSSLSCKKVMVEPVTAEIQLMTEEVGVTYAFMRIHVIPNRGPWRLMLIRNDGIQIFESQYASSALIDTLVIDPNLKPKQSVSYKAYYMIDGIAFDSSSSLLITTVDTSSQNFSWQIHSIGMFSSNLYDVAIINDTCVWVVGEIEQYDFLNNLDIITYGAAIWNGQRWRLMKIPRHDYGSTTLTPSGIRAIHAIGLSDIYVAADANFLHWDGNKWQEKAFFAVTLPFDGQVNKIWGTDKTNMYCVGKNGAIYYINDTSWQKLESGTTLDVEDVWGVSNTDNSDAEIMAVASKHYINNEKKILKITGATVTTFPDSGMDFTPLLRQSFG